MAGTYPLWQYLQPEVVAALTSKYRLEELGGGRRPQDLESTEEIERFYNLRPGLLGQRRG